MKQTNPDHPDPEHDAPTTDPAAHDAPTDAGPEQPSDASATATAIAQRQPQTDETIKETFESIIIAFILAFVFRAYVVEAFVIPTGSEAPTLLGAHYRVECPQCGYTFTINYDPQHHPAAIDPNTGRVLREARWSHGATCPMCRYNIDMTDQHRGRPGDRILVQKFIYAISQPKRWDTVVFKAPHQPNTNFIKRLVGLPNETIHLLDGNLYVQAKGETTWKIARKGDSPKVQRAVWQPIYHSEYIPRDHGDLLGPGKRVASHRWHVPWVAKSGQWDLENTRSYRYQGGEPGRISYDFLSSGRLEIPALYPYNQLDSLSNGDDIEDIRLAVAVQPDDKDTTLSLSTQTRLTGPTQTVTATITAAGKISLTTIDPKTGTQVVLLTADGPPLKPGIATPVELWSVDQELSVFVNGKRELRYLYASELTEAELFARPEPPHFPEITIEVSGSGATLHQVELDRDLFYASNNPGGPARGGVMRDMNGKVMANRIRPMVLGKDEFFCIGDNSPLSDDGRFWDPNPRRDGDYKNVPADALWIRKRYFHNDISDNSADGIVPRELMMGKAFYVYFPAPFSWSPNGMRVIPNFGDMRFIH